jgi:hypothetical protein
MLLLILAEVRKMTSKRSLIAALIGFALMTAMPVVADAGGRQEPGAVVPIGHHYGWRNHTYYSPGLVCDDDGDDCHPAMQCDEDGDDCHSSWSDEDDDYEPYSGYEREYYPPSYYGGSTFIGRDAVPTYNSYHYNPGYDGAYNAPYYNNGTHGTTSPLLPLLLTLMAGSSGPR